MPRTTQHAIHKSTPQFAKQRLDPLTQTANECSPFLVQLSAIFRRNEQHLGFISHHFGQRCANISQVTQQDSTVNRERQRRSSITVMEIGGQQHAATNVTVQVAQQMQLEAEEPAGRRFAPVSTIFSEESYPSMPNRLADWNRLGVNQIERRGWHLRGTRRFSQLPNQCGQSMKPRQPLFVRDQMREGCAPVLTHQQVSFLQCGATERALQQSNSQDLGVRKGWLRVRRTSLACAPRVGFEIIINKAVDFNHLMLYAAQGRCPPQDVDKVSQLHSTHLVGGDDL